MTTDSSIYTLNPSDIQALLTDPDVAPTDSSWLTIPSTLTGTALTP